jgi:hypothetical protein
MTINVVIIHVKIRNHITAGNDEKR